MKFYSIFVALLILLSPGVYGNNFKLICGAVAQASEVTEQKVAELYVATFNRAPDKPGLDFWVNDSGFTIEQIATSFFDQTETQDLYPPGTTETEFVTSVYDNLFNRLPDAAGLDYWVDALGSYAVTRPIMIEAVKNGAQATDAKIVANKAEVGLYYANKDLQEYFLLSNVTEDLSTVEIAKSNIDENLVAETCDVKYIPSIERGNFDDFKRSANIKSYGYLIENDFTDCAPVSLVESFDVRPGDCSTDGKYDDCAEDSERSELAEIYKSTFSGDEYYYGWSIYFPDDYVNVYPTKVALGQFHQKGAHVIWMFQNYNGGYHLDNQVAGHSSTDDYIELIKENELRGKWHKIEVHVRWSTDQSGFFRVSVNDKKISDYSGPTMTANAVYFKYGLYRSFVLRYLEKNNVDEVPAQKVFFSNVKRGNSREELVP